MIEDKSRLLQLDSLRGLAALSVVFCHFLNVFPSKLADTYNVHMTGIKYYFNLIKYSPLSIIFGGHEAVILFFILSGFVLSLPFYSNTVAYKKFLVKRVCRIYIPYITAVLFSYIGFILFSRGGIRELSGWFNSAWLSPVSFKDLISHFIMLGAFDFGKLDNAIWSLVHEMRISLIFPLIMIFVLREGWKKSLLWAGTAALITVLISNAIQIYIINNVLLTIRYIFMFVIGVTLAQNRSYLIDKFKSLNCYMRFGLFILAIIAYTNGWNFHGFKIISKFLQSGELLNDWLTALGSSMLIVIALSYKGVTLIKPVQFLGKISYSLYLLHLPTMYSTVYLLYGRLPIWGILSIAFVITIVLSYISYKIIEVPSIALGKKLTTNKYKTLSVEA